MSKHIVVIPGDGIGEEITDSAVQVLQEVDAVCKIGLTFERRIAGGTAYDECGSPLPKETIEAAKKADAILFGAVGGDKWDNVEPTCGRNKPSWAFEKPSAFTSTCVPSRCRRSWPSIRP